MSAFANAIDEQEENEKFSFVILVYWRELGFVYFSFYILLFSVVAAVL
jgi:hypothetical protein